MAAKVSHEDHEIIELDSEEAYFPDKSQKESVSTPLLPGNSSFSTQEDIMEPREAGTNDTNKRATPIPKLQIVTLCAVRIVDPISFTQLFPYVNEMMRDLHVTDQNSRIGFYSGLVESTFSISQFLSIYHWGVLSDRIGRRPVIFTSTIGIALCTTWFGLSKTLLSALAARSVAGLLAGNIAVIYSLLAELTDKTNEAKILPIYCGLVWPIGGTIGPVIGGKFSHPAIQWPRYFDNEWFRQHPYFLPCFISSLLAFIAAAFGIRFLKETHPRLSQNKYNISPDPVKNLDEVTVAFDDIPCPTTAPPPSRTTSIKKLISNPLIMKLCVSGGCLSFLSSAFDVVYVLFCFSPIASGGLSRSTDEIGYSLAISGATLAGLYLFVMPWLLRTFNLDMMYRRCLGIYPFLFASLPILNYVARMGVDETGALIVPWVKNVVWGGVIVVLMMSRIAMLAFGFAFILVKDSAPNPQALGSTNGLAQFFQCSMKSLSPAIVSSLFATSIDNNLLGGQLWAVVMCIFAIVGYYVASKVPEARRARI